MREPDDQDQRRPLQPSVVAGWTQTVRRERDTAAVTFLPVELAIEEQTAQADELEPSEVVEPVRASLGQRWKCAGLRAAPVGRETRRLRHAGASDYDEEG
ncbi:MAG TPA: hypothetical protein VFX08_16155 [Gaiella sp.]|nr:hypothetical protein [Gaiella sp.]